MTEGITLDSQPWTFERQSDLIKFRSFQDLFDTRSPVGDGYDVTASSIKEYFSSHIVNIGCFDQQKLFYLTTRNIKEAIAKKFYYLIYLI